MRLPGRPHRRFCAPPTALLLGLVVGVGARIALAVAFVGHAYSDNAIIALEAKHALRGHFYAFHWGQSYMGTLEALVIAPFFALFGTSELVLSIGLMPWFVLFALALYALASRCAGRAVGVIVVWLAALAPPLVLLYTVTPCGGYPETLVFGTTILWLTLRVVFDPLPPASRTGALVAIGAVAGLAFWSDWLVAPYLAVAALYLLLDDPWLPLRPAGWLAIGAFALCAAPLWVFNWSHRFATFAFVTDAAQASGRFESLQYALSDGLPTVLGILDPDGNLAFGWVGGAFALAVTSSAGLLVVRLHASWSALWRARIRETDPKLVLVLLGIACVGIYAFAIPSRVHQNRYLLPLASATMPLLAGSLVELRRRARGLAVFLPAVLAFYALQAVAFGRRLAAEPVRNDAGRVERLRDFLPKAGIRFAYADWGDAMIATYLTNERTIVTDYREHTYPLDEVNFRDPAVILRDDPGASANDTLRSLGAEFTLTRIPGYLVYWPIRYDGVRRAPLPRDGWKISATADADDVDLVLDGDPTIAWSPPPVASRPAITLDLGRSETISGIYLALGGRANESFHRLAVEASPDSESWQLVKEAQWDFPATFRSDGQVSILPDDVQTVLFPPRAARWLRLTLLEPFPGQSWTVAELEVFGPAADGPLFQTPSLGNPSSFPVVERRLRRELERHPESDAALVALRALYRERGDPARLAELDRLETERFSPATRLGWSFGGELELVGYDRRELSERQIELTYYWKACRPIDRDYAASVHFDGAGSHFQSDYILGDATRTTRTWRPGEIFKQTERVTIPDGVSTGLYEVKRGVWCPADHRHLRLGSWWSAGKAGDLFHLEVVHGKRLAAIG